jgi:hypothetical protein
MKQAKLEEEEERKKEREEAEWVDEMNDITRDWNQR